jgi:NADH-quinone oxidoreductase subunit K
VVIFYLFWFALEMLLLSVNVGFILLAYIFDDLLGFLFSLIILTLAAAESALGLAIAVSYFRMQADVTVDFISALKG